MPSGSAEACGQRVAAMPLPGRRLSTIAPMLAIMHHLNAQLAYSDQATEQLAAQDTSVQRLRTVPSIGPVTATAFVATLDDVRRLHHAHQVEAYPGLVPRERSSGETQRRGHITKAGHARVRWLLVHTAVSILRRRPPTTDALRGGALHIAARRGTPIAVVALARRLAGILSALLRDGNVEEPRPAPHHPDPVVTLPA